MRRNRPSQCRQRGSAFLTTFGILALLGAAAMAFLDYSTQAVRIANRQVLDAQTTHLCEAGVQSVLRALWRPFKVEQKFVTMDSACLGASEDTPRVAQSGAIDGIGRFAAGVVGIQSPNGDPYQRLVTVRSVGWIDRNSNGQWDAGEARKIVDVTAVFALARSQVFDYTYFVNNYGWFYGFSPTSMVVNGDVRANGNMDISGGFPTINGSIVAALNEKLVPAAPGLVNTPAVKDSNSTYRDQSGQQPPNEARLLANRPRGLRHGRVGALEGLPLRFRRGRRDVAGHTGQPGADGQARRRRRDGCEGHSALEQDHLLSHHQDPDARLQPH
jgi:hypothetical protein